MGYSYLGDEKNSIDTLKLLNVNLNNLGFRTVTVRQIYPIEQDNICNRDNHPNCNTYQLFNTPKILSNEVIISTPVSLYFPLTEQYTAGILEIKWYY